MISDLGSFADPTSDLMWSSAYLRSGQWRPGTRLPLSEDDGLALRARGLQVRPDPHLAGAGLAGVIDPWGRARMADLSRNGMSRQGEQPNPERDGGPADAPADAGLELDLLVASMEESLDRLVAVDPRPGP